MTKKRGEVWKVNLDPTIGSEITKARPCVVVSFDEEEIPNCVIVSNDDVGILPLRIIVPITGWDDKYTAIPWLIPIIVTSANGLVKKSVADTFQVRSISEDRFIEKLGDISPSVLEQINTGLRTCLCLE